MHTVREAYTQVRRTAEKTGRCPVCGGRVVRRRTFKNTVNRNKSGAARTYREAWERVTQLGVDWVPDFTHAKCALDGEQ